MIINKKNILHIQEPIVKGNLISVEIYMISGMLQLGFNSNDLIQNSVKARAEMIYQQFEQDMSKGIPYITFNSILFDRIFFLPYANDQDFVIKASTR